MPKRWTRGRRGRRASVAIANAIGIAPLCVICCLPRTREAYKFNTHSYTQTLAKRIHNSHTHRHTHTCARLWLALWCLVKETMNPDNTQRKTRRKRKREQEKERESEEKRQMANNKKQKRICLVQVKKR